MGFGGIIGTITGAFAPTRAQTTHENMRKTYFCCVVQTVNNDSYIIGGIDPGMRTGGIVLLQTDPEKVLAAYSMVETRGTTTAANAQTETILSAGWGDKEFTSAALRANGWLERFKEILDEIEEVHGHVRVWAIESFVDQRSRAREEQERLVRKRWMTPLVMGLLAYELQERGYSVDDNTIVYQNAGVVIRQNNEEIARLANRRNKQLDVVVPGDHLITNDHTRKAFAHALSLSSRYPNIRREEEEA